MEKRTLFLYAFGGALVAVGTALMEGANDFGSPRFLWGVAVVALGLLVILTGYRVSRAEAPQEPRMDHSNRVDAGRDIRDSTIIQTLLDPSRLPSAERRRLRAVLAGLVESAHPVGELLKTANSTAPESARTDPVAREAYERWEAEAVATIAGAFDPAEAQSFKRAPELSPGSSRYGDALGQWPLKVEEYAHRLAVQIRWVTERADSLRDL